MRKHFFLKEMLGTGRQVVKDLCEKGNAAYQAIIHLLDLKQKQASLFEAKSATIMVRESEKLNETLMLVSPRRNPLYSTGFTTHSRLLSLLVFL